MNSSQPIVYIVDDDPAGREALQVLCQSASLRVKTYDSAQSFLDDFQPRQGGCLVLDVCMTGLAGIELQRQLAVHQIDIPVILLTGYADVAMAVQALKGGAFDLIEKPFDNEVLLKRIKEALAPGSDRRQDSDFAFLALASLGDGVITTDRFGIVTYLNSTAEQLTGWNNSEARGKPLQDVFNVIDETTREPMRDLLSPCLSDARGNGGDQENRVLLLRRDNREVPIDQSVTPIRDQAGNTLGAVILFQDATQARDMTRQLSYQATHDALTGLVNRREFERRLERVMESACERKSEHTLCYLDLDRFKVVNDTAGHSAGDELLRQISAIWSRRLRQRDTLARLGGDEFAVLLEHCPLDQGISIANELLKATQDFRFSWQDRLYSIGVSIGVSIGASAIVDASKSAKKVIQIADAACYAAKREGRNRIHIHSPSYDGEQPKNWVTYLDQALREDRLQLFQQLITPASEARPAGYHQILLRMQSAGEETVTMGFLLPSHERAGLAPILDRWVLRQVLRWLNSDLDRLRQLRLCALNMSRYTLEDRTFVIFLQQQLERFGTPASKLCLVFNEATIVGNPDGAQRSLNAIKGIGCYIAVDDFASTPSGFYYLKHLPVNFLKIDGRLISGMVGDRLAFAIVKSITEIAHIMGIKTIAKGVDSSTIAAGLRVLPVDFLQGYHISKPVQLEL